MGAKKKSCKVDVNYMYVFPFTMKINPDVANFVVCILYKRGRSPTIIINV